MGRRIAFCSENRKTEGIIGDLTVRENIILALQAKDGMFKTIPRKRQEELAGEYIRMLNINPPSPDQLIKNLSGGNQQKVLLARWLLTEPELFILDEPTRGIDIGAKAEIQKLVLTLSRQGDVVPVHLLGAGGGAAGQRPDRHSARPPQGEGNFREGHEPAADYAGDCGRLNRS
ncbi:ATP-binding cassette domain-containing protein [Paenibacillus rhizoplanae]